MFDSKCDAVRTSAICRPASTATRCASDSGAETNSARTDSTPSAGNLRWPISKTAGTIAAGSYEFAPQEEESEMVEVAENGQAPEMELAEA